MCFGTVDFYLADAADPIAATYRRVFPGLLKPLEAMAQGRLLVASDVGGHRELIRDQETGVLFKAGDVDALACKVLDLLSDRRRWS